MATNEIDKAVTTIHGVASQDAELATRHVSPARYVEHDPTLADGADAIKQLMSLRPEQERHLQVIRTLQDRPFVLIQSQEAQRGREVRFDVFRFEDGMIAEHWGFSTKSGPPNQSGHTQADGPTEPTDDENTANSKAFARRYYETVHVDGRHDAIREMVAAGCIRHEPGVTDGVDAFVADLQAITQDRTIDEVVLLIGQGDLVFIAAR
jgi:predicted SnoaL-like aldol condensation-catalyzing enzyme